MNGAVGDVAAGNGAVARIRPATDLDWPHVFPFFAAIVQAGQSYASPPGPAAASVMVDLAAAGGGIGRALGEHAVGWVREAGYRAIQFNAVIRTNAAAVTLRRSLGFRVIGTVPGAFRHAQHGFVGLHVMHLDLTAPDPAVPDPTAQVPARVDGSGAADSAGGTGAH